MPPRRNATPTLHQYLERLPRGRRRPGSCPPDDLAVDHLGLVVGIARRYWFDEVALDDVIQAGNLGLLRAARSFDRRHGGNLTTWLSFGIRQAILEHLARHQHALALPRNVHQRLVGGGQPLGLSPAPLRRILAVSLDDADLGDRPDAAGAGLALPVQPDEAPACAERVMLGAEIAALLTVLDPPARQLIVERFGLDGRDPRGVVAQAAERGISREAVRLRYNTAMAKLASEARRRRLELWLEP